jgi:hypothetical protein
LVVGLRKSIHKPFQTEFRATRLFSIRPKPAA